MIDPNSIQITKTDDDGFPLEARVPDRVLVVGERIVFDSIDDLIEMGNTGRLPLGGWPEVVE